MDVSLLEYTLLYSPSSVLPSGYGHPMSNLSCPFLHVRQYVIFFILYRHVFYMLSSVPLNGQAGTFW
jgi:hypothetical protein